MDPDTILFASFIACLALVAYFNRSRLSTQPIIGRFLYLSIYRSRVGISFMKRAALRFNTIIQMLSPVIIFIGFAGMALVSCEILYSLYSIIANPATTGGVALVLPIKAKGVFYVPFTFWILSIFFVVLVHEGAHGIIAMANKIRIKSSGLAALAIGIPIIPAAFVEPNEKVLQKRPARQQLSVFAAGPVANIASAILITVFFIFVTNPLIEGHYEKDGLRVTSLVNDKDLPVQSSGLEAGMVVTAIDQTPVKDMKGLNAAFMAKKPSDAVSISVTAKDGSNKVIPTTLVESKEKPDQAYLGAYFEQARHVKEARWWLPMVEWIDELLVWIAAMSLGVGLFNLLPLGIVDGGRMMHVALHRFLHENHANAAWAAVSSLFFFIVVGSIVISVIK